MADGEKSGELYCLDADVWEPVKIAKGELKGQHPVITLNGTVYVDRTRVGEDVRVFIRKQKPKQEELKNKE
jgi:hypothetical protein